MVKVDLGILNLLGGRPVDSEGDERGDVGGHLGHEFVLLRLTLPLIDNLDIGLVLSVRK